MGSSALSCFPHAALPDWFSYAVGMQMYEGHSLLMYAQEIRRAAL